MSGRKLLDPTTYDTKSLDQFFFSVVFIRNDAAPAHDNLSNCIGYKAVALCAF